MARMSAKTGDFVNGGGAGELELDVQRLETLLHLVVDLRRSGLTLQALDLGRGLVELALDVFHHGPMVVYHRIDRVPVSGLSGVHVRLMLGLERGVLALSLGQLG